MSDEDFQNYEIQRKATQAADKREYYKINKEKIKAQRKSCAERTRSEMISGVKDKEAFTKKYDEFIKKQNDEKKIKSKERYQANKEKTSEQGKERYQANKEKISEQGKIKVTCECGLTISRNSKSKHLKTAKHCNYIKNK